MAAEVAVDHSIIVNFAKKLAGNEKKFRDRAVKKLKKWIETKSIAEKGVYSPTNKHMWCFSEHSINTCASS